MTPRVLTLTNMGVCENKANLMQWIRISLISRKNRDATASYSGRRQAGIALGSAGLGVAGKREVRKTVGVRRAG
jgi:hypothetical protein